MHEHKQGEDAAAARDLRRTEALAARELRRTRGECTCPAPEYFCCPLDDSEHCHACGGAP